MATSATADGAEIEDQGTEGKKKRKRLILIAAALLLLVGGGGGGTYYFLNMKKAAEPTTPAAGKKPSFFDLPEITVNLAPTPGIERAQYLKIKIALEVAEAKTIAEIQPVMPRVMDNFQVYLRELRASDLEGSPGLYRLREELVRRINAAVYPAKVEAVLFKDILVQ